MKRKHTSTNAARRYLRRRKDQRARAERVRGLIAKREQLKRLIAECVSGGGDQTKLRLHRSQLRTVEQQIRYINHPNHEL